MAMLVDPYEIIIIPANFLRWNCTGSKTEVVGFGNAPGDEGHLDCARSFNLLFERDLFLLFRMQAGIFDGDRSMDRKRIDETHIVRGKAAIPLVQELKHSDNSAVFFSQRH